MLKRIVCLMTLCTPLLASSQYEFSTFTSTGRGGATTFATDYQCLGINPANLGWAFKFGDKHCALGGPEFSFSLHSMALAKPELRSLLKEALSGKYESLTYDQKLNAAQDFTKTGFAMN